MSKLKISLVIVLCVALMMVTAIGARKFGFVKYATHATEATVTVPAQLSKSPVISGFSAYSDTSAGAMTIYGLKRPEIYHTLAKAASGQAEVVVTPADTLVLVAGAVVVLQDDKGNWVQFDSVASITDSTLTLSSNLTDTLRATDYIYLMEKKALVVVDSASAETHYFDEGVFRLPVGSPLHISLVNADPSKVTIQWLTGYYE